MKTIVINMYIFHDFFSFSFVYSQVHAVPVNHGHNVSEWSTVTISLIDENDNAPTFQGLPYYFNISKNTSISSKIKQVSKLTVHVYLFLPENFFSYLA